MNNMNKSDPVIVSAIRTPFGKFGGTLKDISPSTLGSIVIKEIYNRINLAPDEIDEVIMGNCIPSGQGQVPAREAALKANLPYNVSALTINKACISALHAVSLATIKINAGLADVIIAGGMESMSNTPYMLLQGRWGLKMGDVPLIDLITNALKCPFTGKFMGEYADEAALKYNISRSDQDEWAYKSQQNYSKAFDEGKFKNEIMPVLVPSKDKIYSILQDEFPKPDTTLEGLSKLKPAFKKDGTVTAGNSPGLNDGAAILIIMSSAKAKSLGLKPLARIVKTAEASFEPAEISMVPALALQKALKETDLTINNMDVIEINEAFAAVTLISAKILNADTNKINVNGGSVAIGHPVGATGARILMTLIYELKRRNKEYGAATICGAGATGEAIIVQNIR